MDTSPKIELLTIGDEIISGSTLDTNASCMARTLWRSGFSLSRKTTVGDNEKDILAALERARSTMDVVFTTGGLGPTSDDVTKACLSRFFSAPLKWNKGCYEQTRGEAEKNAWGISEEELKKSAYLPNGATALPNRVGVAPGLWLCAQNFLCIALPGVPREMEEMLKREVMPKLGGRFHATAPQQKTLHTWGVREVALAEQLEDFERALPSFIKLSYLPHSLRVSLVLTLSAKAHADAQALGRFREAYECLAKQLQEHLYGTDEDTWKGQLTKLLAEKERTVGTAESCTGGRVAAALTETPGSTKSFVGSIVAYQNRIKERLLRVDAQTIAIGTVGARTAIEMAHGARKALSADIGLSTTGLMGGTERERGVIYWGIADKEGAHSEHEELWGSRSEKLKIATEKALYLLWRHVRGARLR